VGGRDSAISIHRADFYHSKEGRQVKSGRGIEGGAEPLAGRTGGIGSVGIWRAGAGMFDGVEIDSGRAGRSMVSNTAWDEAGSLAENEKSLPVFDREA